MRLLVVVLFALAASVLTQAQSPAAKPANDDQQIAGTWRGNSTCIVKDSPCHDEVNVYHISRIAEKPNSFMVSGSKVVDGNEIVMGSGEWTYDAQKHNLSWETAGRTFKFTVKGDKMEGTLTSGGVLYRRIFLKKEK
ncbi:MAG TPA: hypothetical protein VJA94_03465 [Candidatus Angelobacter sp.]